LFRRRHYGRVSMAATLPLISLMNSEHKYATLGRHFPALHDDYASFAGIDTGKSPRKKLLRA
jgi:hypothetical protein